LTYAFPGIRDGCPSGWWRHAADASERDESWRSREMDHLSSQHNCRRFAQQLRQVVLSGEFAQDTVFVVGEQNPPASLIGCPWPSPAFCCSGVPLPLPLLHGILVQFRRPLPAIRCIRSLHRVYIPKSVSNPPILQPILPSHFFFENLSNINLGRNCKLFGY
jgi:hypothetical protein